MLKDHLVFPIAFCCSREWSYAGFYWIEPHHQECPIRLGKFSRMRSQKISKTATAGPGADSVLIDRHITCAASRARSQRPALLQAAAETTASGSTGTEDLKAYRRVRHYKEVGLQEWPLAGRATVPGVLHGIGLCMSLRQKVHRHLHPSSSPFTLFAR